MASDGTSFLPRILSVFYAVFHDNRGTNIVYQVPEGLILTPPVQGLNTSFSGSALKISSPERTNGTSPGTSESRSGETANQSRTSSSSRYSHLANSRDTLGSSFVRSSSANHYLFKFEDISRYLIPPSSLCGRLATFATRRYQIIGFPVELYDEKRYERNFFRYNVCFVFERTADLSCYEPIVRKIGRVLTTCEEESSFLSSPETSHKIHAILEQLFEDLNSYSETSIPIDKFNSIELKIFPFYPNPPDAHDWDVPVALINLKKRIEDNWDLTMAKVCQHIDGTNHVSRIAHLADCDLDLTRNAIQHLLFYQVIMMIDIFQFSNMYTLCRSVGWLADEAHVREECGPYVTRPDREISEWPDLLHLYSRLKPGITVFEWMHEYDTHKHGIDPRRFVSFGVIKGFLRRVHRWPVLLPPSSSEKEKERRASSASFGRRRGKSVTSPTGAGVGQSNSGTASPPLLSGASAFSFLRNADGQFQAPITSVGLGRHPSLGETDRERFRPMRRTSAAEKYLEQFRREIDRDGLQTNSMVAPVKNAPKTSPRTQRYSRASDRPSGRRNSLTQPTFVTSSSVSSSVATEYGGGEGSGSGFATPTRPRLSRSPSSHATTLVQNYAGSSSNLNLGSMNTSVPSSNAVPFGLKELLDGKCHADELGVRFELGWPALEKQLVAIGGGKGDGDFGRVEIIYR